ncbi:unnamed protein product [Trichogramma brassicae]|uniref:RNA-directed DNA polymerase n=1 Tax=Trichogramma brassicae TaxID=86971 RepID=A0A6H5I720_9HYME|nr:unnamed protein product [Trichogramma brassicae]
MSKSYLDENDLLRTITEFEGLEQARKQRIDSQTAASKTTAHDDRRKGKHGGKMQRSSSEASGYSKKSSENGVEEDNSISKSKNVSNVECYKCHATGHIAKYCKSAVTCFNCGVIGHISKNCDKPKKMPTAESKLINANCADASAKFLKNVKIGNVENVHAVIDSELKVENEPIVESDFVVGPAVDAKQKESLLRLLNEYRVCCSRSDRELGCTNYVEMDIIETADATPVYSKPYKASAKQREEMKSIVGEWKAAGIVTETQSPYASPCLLVDKPDGSKRLVVDYRRLNKNTVRMNFPLPNIDDGLEELHGANIFAILDLAQGYLQIPLTERAKEKTAFITPDETGQFERAMFGLMNAPFYFSKLMKKVFGNFQNKLALFFFDDMLVYAKSWDELLEKLETILQLLRDARLMLKLRKCRFGLEEVEYVGLIVGKNGIKPGERKIVAISEFPAPRNEHEVRRFIGMASYFRRFVRNFAQIAAPLSALLKKDTKFAWGEKQQSAFDEIKTILSSRPVLIPYNAKASKTELHCDASADGLGAMLFQASADDVLHPVYAISRRTTDVEPAVCNLTKFCQLYAVRNVKASTTARCIEKLIERFGAPIRFITDRGTAFTSSVFENLCKKHGIKHTLNSSRHAQANGQVERLNQTILPALQANLTDAEGLHWDKNLAKLENDLNASINKTTGKTPFEMLYGYIPRFEEGLSRVLTCAAETYRLPIDVRNEAIKRIEQEQVNAKARYDKARVTNVKYDVGDIVFMKQNKIATGDSTKLQSRYKGPLVITEALPADTYRVQNLNAKNDSKDTTSHVSQLKLWRNQPDDDDDCNDYSDTESEDSVESNSLNQCSSPKEHINNNNHIVTPEKESEGSNLLFSERPKRNRRMPNKFNLYLPHFSGITLWSSSV